MIEYFLYYRVLELWAGCLYVGVARIALLVMEIAE